MLYSRFSRLTLQLRIYITLQEPLPEKITALNSLVEPMQPLLPALKAAASSLPSTSLLGPVLLIYELEVGKWKFKGTGILKYQCSIYFHFLIKTTTDQSLNSSFC
ncbi:uncharacterized protein LOC113597531 isoform X2 [Acinonyx jubatus]|uniref:Uncharacterized protein LOC113597531 isoform X2 n=1 Tax=Acinonyx jubatus TaxID=32536 RepID=A0ABM3PIJ9_ACIJB|nr:uncharacterized protein LOC113597531 isoform X2 [Acinonyx jubatus]